MLNKDTLQIKGLYRKISKWINGISLGVKAFAQYQP